MNWISERGVVWSGLYVSRLGLLKCMHIGKHIVKRIDRSLIKIEKSKYLTGSNTITSQYHTVETNRKLWNSYDWSREGEEWTQDAKAAGCAPDAWKDSLINEIMWKYIKPDRTVLEIGPGGGRWTEHLLKRSERVILADISQACLDKCKARFQSYTNVDFHLVANQGLSTLADNLIDAIWSYDVFVHINPTDIENYLKEFPRILKPGGYGIIHHAGAYPGEDEEFVRTQRFRSFMDKDFFAYLVQREGLILIEQDNVHAHVRGDIISVFQKPG